MKRIFTKKRALIAAGIAVAVIIIGSLLARGGRDEAANGNSQRVQAVSILRLADAGANSGPRVTASGTVRAGQEANLVSEASGVVRTVHVSIGDAVARGQALVTLSNADAVAQVAQARATLSAAQSSVQSSDITLANAASTLQNSLEATMRTMDEVRDIRIAPLFSDRESLRNFGVQWTDGATTYSITASAPERGEIIDASREMLEAMQRAQRVVDSRDSTTILQAATAVEETLVKMRTLLDILAARINEYSSQNSTSQAVYDRFQTDMSAGRATVATALTSLRSSVQAYRSAQTRDTTSGVEQARAALMAAEAQLAKTVIRAPFAGRVLSVTPRAGEFLGMGSPAVSLLGSSGKEVQVYLDANDAAQVAVGARVTVGEGAAGIITRKAPGIDPETGKVEATISIVANDPSIVIGEFVTVSIPVSSRGGQGMRIPLKAVKLTSAGAEVYIVRDGIVEARTVSTGSLEGDYITVTSGLEGIEGIIENVRGLSAGDEVLVSQQ